ncbi:hypothetical protein [Stutzerimonas stutzeri]|uniref:hypothetical protein n=1 Tax=Stutzerimonas stutzeri TaxID=316 RepID=UPI001F04EC0E|nr:hypothetical protein [Stutzerimonas stutzeri]
MAALDYLRRAGLTVESVADRLRVSPVERITDPLRHFIREHLAELLAELNAANDSTRSPAPGYTVTAAIASHEWCMARDQYVSHLMACRACYATTGRYCAAGTELRWSYNHTPMFH